MESHVYSLQKQEIKYAIKNEEMVDSQGVCGRSGAHQHQFEIQPLETNDSSGVTDAVKESPGHKRIVVILPAQEAYELTSIFLSKQSLNEKSSS